MTNERAKGHVKWFNPDKGYGFIQSAEGEEYFVHFSAIKQQGYRSLADFAEVEFDIEIEQSSGRKLAKNVTGPAHTIVPSSTRPLSARARACAYRTGQEQWFKAMLGRSASMPPPPRGVMMPPAMMGMMPPFLPPAMMPAEAMGMPGMPPMAPHPANRMQEIDMMQKMEAAAAMFGTTANSAEADDMARYDEAKRLFAALNGPRKFKQSDAVAAAADGDQGPDGHGFQADAAYWAMMNSMHAAQNMNGVGKENIPPQGDRDREHYWALRLAAANATLHRLRSGEQGPPPPGFEQMHFEQMQAMQMMQAGMMPPMPGATNSWVPPPVPLGDGHGVSSSLPAAAKDAKEFRPGEAFMTNEEAVKNRSKFPPPGLGDVAAKVPATPECLPPPPAYPPPDPFNLDGAAPGASGAQCASSSGTTSPPRQQTTPWLLNMRGDGIMPYCGAGATADAAVPYAREQ